VQVPGGEEDFQPIALCLELHNPNVLVISESVYRRIKEWLEEAVPEECKIVLAKALMFHRSQVERNLNELWVSGMSQEAEKDERKNYILSLLPTVASDQLLCAFSALLSVLYAQKLLGTVEVLSGEKLHMVQSITQFNLKDLVYYDIPTLSALQIFSTDRHPSNFIGNVKEGLSLYTILEDCSTIHGKRLLKQWLLRPLTSIERLEERFNEVDYLYSLPREVTDSLKRCLHTVGTLPTILRQMMMQQGCGRTNKNHLKTLHSCLLGVLEMQTTCVQTLQWRVPLSELRAMEGIVSLEQAQVKGLCAAFERTLDFGTDSDETGDDHFFVSCGVSETLDELKSVYQKLPSLLFEILQSELEKIPSALVRRHEQTEWSLLYLPQYGYVMQMPTRLPPDLAEVFRDYTFVSEFRANWFLYKCQVTQALDEQFGNLFTRIQDLETAILSQFTFEILAVPIWQPVVEATAHIDVLLALALTAKSRNYVRPRLTTDNILMIKNGRHALNEQTIETAFIPNDSNFMEDACRIHIVTGPNFSGKTVYAKQVALIVFMAHIGSFVPADEAKIGVVDNLFTRIDSIDASSFGQSAFMTDLNQVLYMIRNATSRSLIIMDEFGRGTEHSDGLGLFTAVLNYFVEKPYPPKVIACTHFNCVEHLDSIQNSAHVAFDKMECFIENGPNSSHLADGCLSSETKVVYLYKLVRGVSENSLGILCAKLAGLSELIWQRSYQVLRSRAAGKPVERASWCPAVDAQQTKHLQEFFSMTSVTDMAAIPIEKIQAFFKKIRL